MNLSFETGKVRRGVEGIADIESSGKEEIRKKKEEKLQEDIGGENSARERQCMKYQRSLKRRQGLA